MDHPILEMHDISKSFGAVRANEDINLNIYTGEIQALLGENGAGKSTLMNILTGIYRADSGRILFDGREVSVRSPKDAVNLGIGMVHQHFLLVPTLTVAENICLYSDKKGFFLHEKEMEERIADCSKKFGMAVDPGAPLWQLSVGEQQRVEILKLLYHGAQILILDEPTAVLTPQEAEDMFRTLRKMTDEGKAVVIISHKMQEVMNHTDRITVLKGGRVEDTMMTSDATIDRLTRAVVGNRSISPLQNHASSAESEVVLSLKEVNAKNDKNLPALQKVSFEIHKGEIFGLAGVAGNGQRELCEVLAGLRETQSGTIILKGEDITKDSIRTRNERGIAYIPEDRLHTGLVPEMDMTQNILLKKYQTDRYSKRGILQPKQAVEDTEQFVSSYDIKNGGLDQPVGLMSGGNQQKLLCAREVFGDIVLLIAAYPVRGLDIGAAATVRELLVHETLRGTAVLLVSEELEEIFELSDRIGVLCDGKLMGIRKTSETDYMEIGKMMTGEITEAKKNA